MVTPVGGDGLAVGARREAAEKRRPAAQQPRPRRRDLQRGGRSACARRRGPSPRPTPAAARWPLGLFHDDDAHATVRFRTVASVPHIQDRDVGAASKAELAKAGLALVAHRSDAPAIAVESEADEDGAKDFVQHGESFPQNIVVPFMKQGPCQSIVPRQSADWHASCCSVSDSCTEVTDGERVDDFDLARRGRRRSRHLLAARLLLRDLFRRDRRADPSRSADGRCSTRPSPTSSCSTPISGAARPMPPRASTGCRGSSPRIPRRWW